MSSINYNLKNKGVRLVSSDKAWVKGKNGKFRLNPAYSFVGKIDTEMPNMVVSTVKAKKPTYKGDINDLNRTAKKQIVDHFYDDKGKRNKKTVAYLAIEKNKNSGGF